MGKTLRPVNKPTQNWDKLQHLAHLWILTCSWQLSHCIWVIKTLPRHFKKTIIKEVPPALLRASGLRWKNQAWRSLWGRWRREARWRRWRREAHLNQFSERRGSNFFGFCNSHAARCLAIWCSDEKSYTGGWQMGGMWWKSFKVKIFHQPWPLDGMWSKFFKVKI